MIPIIQYYYLPTLDIYIPTDADIQYIIRQKTHGMIL